MQEKGPDIHCLHMRQFICKFHLKIIFWILVQMCGKIYRVIKQCMFNRENKLAFWQENSLVSL